MSETNPLLGMVPWTDGKPAPRRPTVPIISPKFANICRGVLLGGSLVGADTHWVDGRTVPCIAPRSACEGCRRWNRRLWKGYLAAVQLPSLFLGMFELTPEAAKGVSIGEDGTVNHLRGLYIATRRENGRRQGKVLLSLSALPKEWRTIVVPEPFDVREELLAIWGAPTRTPAPEPPAGPAGEEIPL